MRKCCSGMAEGAQEGLALLSGAVSQPRARGTSLGASRLGPCSLQSPINFCQGFAQQRAAKKTL